MKRHQSHPTSEERVTVSAPKLCAQRGWKAGVRLTSSKWNAPRTLAAVDAFEATLVLRDNRGEHKRFTVKTFPFDVQEVAA